MHCAISGLIECFDHPVTKPEWHFDADVEVWEGPVEYISRLFEACDELLAGYSDAQVNQGLSFLSSASCSNHMFALVDERVSWEVRERCVLSMYDAYEKCFARRCSTHLSHLDELGASPLNSACYMWFDVLPIGPKPDDAGRRQLDRAFLAVMKRMLHIPHERAARGLCTGWANGHSATRTTRGRRSGGSSPIIQTCGRNS
jgi:hypothetical protein